MCRKHFPCKKQKVEFLYKSRIMQSLGKQWHPFHKYLYCKHLTLVSSAVALLLHFLPSLYLSRGIILESFLMINKTTPI